MAQIRITTTSSEGLRPLGHDGQRSYEMIAALVGSRLGPNHALLFAEPVAAGGRAETDWYVQAEGAARRLQDLSEADQEVVRLRLSEIVADITRLADELEKSGGDSNERLSESLRNSLEVPDEGAVHVVRDAHGSLLPVVVDWATVREDREMFRGVLSGIAPRKPKPVKGAPAGVGPALSGTVPLASAAPMGLAWLPWLLWTILAAVLIAITVLLIAPCGLRGLAGASFCPVAEMVDPSGALADQAELQERIAALQLAMIRSDQACEAPRRPPPAPEPTPISEPAPPPQGDPEIENRLNNLQGQRGDMNVSLVWDTLSDIDLAVTCPNEVKISFRDRAPAQCSGRLDIDANVQRSRATRTPIENIFFENPQTGSYQIEVSLFSRNGATGDIPFTVQVRLDDTIQRFTGSVGSSSTVWQTRFDYEALR
jgi:hypothetical protein